MGADAADAWDLLGDPVDHQGRAEGEDVHAVLEHRVHVRVGGLGQDGQVAVFFDSQQVDIPVAVQTADLSLPDQGARADFVSAVIVPVDGYDRLNPGRQLVPRNGGLGIRGGSHDGPQLGGIGDPDPGVHIVCLIDPAGAQHDGDGGIHISVGILLPFPVQVVILLGRQGGFGAVLIQGNGDQASAFQREQLRQGDEAFPGGILRGGDDAGLEGRRRIGRGNRGLRGLQSFGCRGEGFLHRFPGNALHHRTAQLQAGAVLPGADGRHQQESGQQSRCFFQIKNHSYVLPFYQCRKQPVFRSRSQHIIINKSGGNGKSPVPPKAGRSGGAGILALPGSSAVPSGGPARLLTNGDF